MGYTPSLSASDAKAGFKKFLKWLIISLIPLALSMLAVKQLNGTLAHYSAVIGLYCSFVSVNNAEGYLNPRNQTIDFINDPASKKYFSYVIWIKYLLVAISATFFIVDLCLAR